MRVVKVGGSLFDLPDMKSRLQNWLTEHDDMPNVLIAGGGKPVEAIRDFQSAHGIDDSEAHWLSIKMMSATAAMIGSLLPESIVTDDQSRLTKQPVTVFDSHSWLKDKYETDSSLEESWNITSDSIAALVALEFDAQELVLLKSTDFDPNNSSFVDGRFSSLAVKLTSTRTSIKMVNFRSENIHCS